jgi:hypothetical protein
VHAGPACLLWWKQGSAVSQHVRTGHVARSNDALVTSRRSSFHADVTGHPASLCPPEVKEPAHTQRNDPLNDVIWQNVHSFTLLNVTFALSHEAFWQCLSCSRQGLQPAPAAPWTLSSPFKGSRVRISKPDRSQACTRSMADLDGQINLLLLRTLSFLHKSNGNVAHGLFFNHVWE